MLPAPDQQRLAAVLQKLELSEEQVTRISLGKAVFTELLNPLTAGWC